MHKRVSNLVVKQRISPWVLYGLMGAVVFFVTIGGMGLYRYGESQAGFNAAQASHIEDHLRQQIVRLRGQNTLLSENVTVIQHASQTQRVAYAALAQSLMQADRQVLRLQEKLGFYQAIMKGSAKGPAVKLEQFHVTAGAPSHYHLVLIQAYAFHRSVVAAVRFTVQGRENGHSSVWSYPGLVDKPLTVHFKYFEDTRGPLILPAGFVPSQVTVQVAVAGRILKQTIPWPAPLAAS